MPALGVAAVTFRATLTGTPVRGAQTDRVLAGFRRDGADRGRGQAAPLTADGLAAILATADRPRDGTVRLTLGPAQYRDDNSSIPLPEASLSA